VYTLNSQVKTLYFIDKFGAEKRRIPFPVSPDIKLIDVLSELGKKLDIPSQNICITSIGGQVLTTSELLLPVEKVIENYGNTFDIIDRGLVGWYE
jgi:hypothetical protein